MKPKKQKDKDMELARTNIKNLINNRFKSNDRYNRYEELVKACFIVFILSFGLGFVSFGILFKSWIGVIGGLGVLFWLGWVSK